jgi:NTP pyrophosphatase (non-canonical NTP hydrolase)
MDKKIDLEKYMKFVDGVTSPTSKEVGTFIERVSELYMQGVNPARLLTAGIGLSGESGEFNEFVKKIVFHGKEFNEANFTALKKELGDIIWYWTQACLALNVDPNQIISDNTDKLVSRYPGGVFSVYHAENRKEGDI